MNCVVIIVIIKFLKFEIFINKYTMMVTMIIIK